MKKIIYITLLTFTFCGCIEEYNMPGVENMSNILVVEGIIEDNETTIKLSKSVGIEDEITTNPVTNAIVHVERSDGIAFYVTSYSNGAYTINNRILDPSLTYKLRIVVDGLEYESSPLSPMSTPEIQDIYLHKEAPGKNIEVCLSTQGTSENSSYYYWSFKEDWEITSRIYAGCGYVDGKLVEWGANNPIYYCWVSHISRNFLIESTNKLAENKISRKVLLSVSPDNNRFSNLYYMKVSQYSIRKEAYDYYSNLQKNIESTGSIFGPIPTEMKGNIRCITDENIPVIGYIEVVKKTVKDIFFPKDANMYEQPYMFCPVVENTHEDYNPSFLIVSPNPGATYAPADCVDCRLNGTKNKPDFWPNDHK